MSQQQVPKQQTDLLPVSKDIQKIVTKQDEPDEGLDVDAYITGMVQATVAMMQTNHPVPASDSKSTQKVTLQLILKQAKNSSA